MEPRRGYFCACLPLPGLLPSITESGLDTGGGGWGGGSPGCDEDDAAPLICWQGMRDAINRRQPPR